MIEILKETNEDIEIDSNYNAWGYYQKKYEDRIIINDVNHIYLSGKRRVCDFDYSQYKDIGKLLSVKRNSKNSKIITLGGDCFFNFNDNKLDMYKKYVPDNDKKTMSALKALRDEKHHNKVNFALIPVTGSMNNLKGRLHLTEEGISYNYARSKSFDRGDTFIYALDKFFEKRNAMQKNNITDICEIGNFLSHSVLKASLGTENFLNLYDFLDCFDKVSEYCDLFYKFSKEETSEMIKHGEKPITSITDLEKYMSFVGDFWDGKIVK